MLCIQQYDEIIFNDEANLLNITKYTQICIFTTSMAIYEVFRELFKESQTCILLLFLR